MSEISENNTEVINTQSVDTGTKVEVTSIEAAQARIKELENNFQEAVITRDKAKEKLRKLEQDFGQASEFKTKYEELFTEKSKLLEQFEVVQSEFTNYKSSVNQTKIDTELTTAIERAGAKSVGTVLKLIDKSKVELDQDGNIDSGLLDALVKQVAESDPVLFEPNFIDPGVFRAGTKPTPGSFEVEIREAKTLKEYESICKKYNRPY